MINKIRKANSMESPELEIVLQGFFIFRYGITETTNDDNEISFEFKELMIPQSNNSIAEARMIASKWIGEEYLDKGLISFTKEDAIGMIQVKTGFELGLTNTNIEFDNGTIVPIEASEFADFAIWFAEKRNSFFI